AELEIVRSECLHRDRRRLQIRDAALSGDEDFFELLRVRGRESGDSDGDADRSPARSDTRQVHFPSLSEARTSAATRQRNEWGSLIPAAEEGVNKSLSWAHERPTLDTLAANKWHRPDDENLEKDEADEQVVDRENHREANDVEPEAGTHHLRNR